VAHAATATGTITAVHATNKHRFHHKNDAKRKINFEPTERRT
jgi:ribosomal protein L35